MVDLPLERPYMKKTGEKAFDEASLGVRRRKSTSPVTTGYYHPLTGLIERAWAGLWKPFGLGRGR